MTKAKPIIKGQIVYGTAKVVRDELWLRDNKKHHIRNMIYYLVAHYASKYGILVHSMVVMSNHYHILLTDPLGKRDRFFKAFHSTLSKHIASRFSKPDAQLLKRGDFHQMVLLDQETVEEQHVYTLLNPVRANIVERYKQYTHVMIDHHDWNVEQVYARPSWFSKYQWPEESLTLVPVPPSYFQQNCDAHNVAYFDAFVEEGHEAYDIFRAYPVIGMEATYLYPRHYSPNQYAAPDDDEVFGEGATESSSGCVGDEIVEQEPAETPIALQSRFFRGPDDEPGRPDYLGQDVAFLDQYGARMASWRDEYECAKGLFVDDRDTLFPPGTVRLAHYGVAVATLSEDDLLNPVVYQQHRVALESQGG